MRIKSFKLGVYIGHKEGIRNPPFSIDNDKISLTTLCYRPDTVREVDAVRRINCGRGEGLFQRQAQCGTGQIHHNGLQLKEICISSD